MSVAKRFWFSPGGVSLCDRRLIQLLPRSGMMGGTGVVEENYVRMEVYGKDVTS